MTNRTCSFDGCEKPPTARGWCPMHYQRWRHTGTTDTPAAWPTVEERFWAKVDRSSGPDACWPWTASLTTFGYGQFNNGNTMVGAHGFAYRQLVGDVPLGLELDHMCHDALLCTLGSDCPHRRCRVCIRQYNRQARLKAASQ